MTVIIILSGGESFKHITSSHDGVDETFETIIDSTVNCFEGFIVPQKALKFRAISFGGENFPVLKVMVDALPPSVGACESCELRLSSLQQLLTSYIFFS